MLVGSLVVFHIISLIDLIEGAVSGQALINLHSTPGDWPALSYPGCSRPSTVSCVRADLNMYVLMTGSAIDLPGGRHLHLSHREEHHACYQVWENVLTAISIVSNLYRVRMQRQYSAGRDLMWQGGCILMKTPGH